MEPNLSWRRTIVHFSTLGKPSFRMVVWCDGLLPYSHIGSYSEQSDLKTTDAFRYYLQNRITCDISEILLTIHRMGEKSEATTFSRISSKTFSQNFASINSGLMGLVGICKPQKIIIRFFLHTSRLVYSEHVYNIRVHALYYLKCRRLVNRFPLDNVTLKLQHHRVGRRLAHRKDKRCVWRHRYYRAFPGPTAISGEKVFGEELKIRARCGHNKWTLQQDSARLLTPPMSSIEPNMTLWPPNNLDLNPVEYAVWGVLQEMVYHCRSFKTVQELRSAISRCINVLTN